MRMKFRIIGADKETGDDVELIIEARDEVEAATIASRRNVMVSTVSLYREQRSPVSKTALATQSQRKQCPKCKEWIHKGATKCPHCRASQPPPPWAYALVAALLVVPAIWCCGPCSWIHNSTSSDRPANTRQELIEKHFSAWDGSHRGLTAYIKKSMNDPDSYQHDETRYVDKGDHLIVFTTFRGKNAFGGVVKNTIAAKVDLQGNVLEIISEGP
ncbi:MAG: hypothetical protein JW741_31580 [Sedimentisphaerales bacterium]|nr:hypothetical protein [Sedimentisphaerales bacterium]